MDPIEPQLSIAPEITPPPAPKNKTDGEITYFAETNFHNFRRKFGIKTDDRRRHMYLIGKTGMGKSTVLENMIMSDVVNGHGLIVIDPLGDLVEKVIDFIPSYRINDVIYFNPADFEYPIAFNVLESVDPDQRHLVSSGLIAVFKKIWVDSWGPRLEYVLRNCILALLEYPGSTLLGVTRLLVDAKYRSKVVAKITDPIVKAFWVDEFGQYTNQFRTEAISPIQNKVGQFLSSSVIRNIVGQSQSSFELRDLMDNSKIILMNLAKGRIGEDNSSLLGSMMITKLQIAAMSRVDIPESERRDFYMFVDEFQNFATDSFATILSEARKYRLDLIIAHQYIEQLSETVRAAVFGNVGTIVCFRIGAADAEFLEKEFAPLFTETDLINLTKYDIYLKLMIDGVASDPFSATGLPPIDKAYGRENNRDKIILSSRERYATARAIVEDKIMRWSGVGEIFRGSASEENANAKGEPEKPIIDLTDKNVVEEPAVIETPAPISLTEALKAQPVKMGGGKKPSNQRLNMDVRKAVRPEKNQPQLNQPTRSRKESAKSHPAPQTESSDKPKDHQFSRPMPDQVEEKKKITPLQPGKIVRL